MKFIIKLNYCVFLLNVLDAFDFDFSSSDTLTLNISNSPYEINKTVAIPLGKTLVIDPGVELRMGPSISMLVEGTLIANGTHEQRIKFKPLADSDFFDASFNFRFANLDLKGGFCVENSDKRTNKEVATAICRHMGYMGESFLYDFLNSSIFSPSKNLLSVSKCKIKSAFLEDNCELNFVRRCFNVFRSVHCSLPLIHNFWSGLYFTFNTNNNVNKSVLIHVDLEKGGLNKTCCSMSQMNHALIKIQSFHLVVLKDVKIIDSASNGISIENMNKNNIESSFALNGIKITNTFLNAIAISSKYISSFELSNTEIKGARTGVLVNNFNGAWVCRNVSFDENKRGIHVVDQFEGKLNATLNNVSFFLNEIGLNDESKSGFVIGNSKFYDSIDFGIRKSKGSVHISFTQFRKNNVSVFLLNSNHMNAYMSGNNFSQDIKHAVIFDDTLQDTSFTLKLSENRFKLCQYQTVLLTLKLAKNFIQSQSNVLIENNTFIHNVGLFVLGFRFVNDFNSFTNYPNRVQVRNNKFIDNEINTYDDNSVNIKKHGVFDVSFGSSKLNEPSYSSSTGYRWQQMLRNFLIEKNTFSNPKSTFEVATFYKNFPIANEHLVKLNISFNNWLLYSNELEILSHINAYHLNKNLAIVVQIYPLYLNGDLNEFGPSGSIVANGNQLGFYVNKNYVLEPGYYTCPYGIIIEQGSSLTIKPKVTIEFQPNTKFLVFGRLDLKGELNKKVHLKFIGSESNNTNSSSSSFNYEKRLRLTPLNSNLSPNYENYKMVEVYLDSKWQPICYNWVGKWIYDYAQGWIYNEPSVKRYLPLLCKWMGVGDCHAKSISLKIDIFSLYPNYVNEFDFDPNFHSNISEVKISSCKSNCVCRLFLGFLPVTSLNIKQPLAAIHYTTYAKASLITNVLASNFLSTVFLIDNQKHLIEHVYFENGNQRSLKGLIIQKQDPLNTNLVIGNIKSKANSLGPVNITLLHNGVTFADLSNISIKIKLKANLEMLNSEFSAFDFHINECEPKVRLENEQISLMTINSANNLSCSMNLTTNFGRRLVVSLIGVERKLCSTNLTVSDGISGSQLIILRTGSNGELRGFFASENNSLSIQLTFSSACSKWNHLKLKFESIGSEIDISRSAVKDSVKILNSKYMTLIIKISRHMPKAYLSGQYKEMRVENTSVTYWLIDDAYTLNNLQFKEIYRVYANNVTFSRSIMSDSYTLSDIHISNSIFENINHYRIKINTYQISILNSVFKRKSESSKFQLMHIHANYLNLSNNTFMRTMIAISTSCFEITNNRFLKIDIFELSDQSRDRDLPKLNMRPEFKCKQLIDANYFTGIGFYLSCISLFLFSNRLEFSFQFRNNYVSNLFCDYFVRIDTFYYNNTLDKNVVKKIELNGNFFADSNFNSIISMSNPRHRMWKETLLKVNIFNNTFSDIRFYALIVSLSQIQQLQLKSNKFMNSIFLNHMELFVDKQFVMEYNEFINNTFFTSMLTLHILDLSLSSRSSKAILRNNSFKSIIQIYYNYCCFVPMIEIRCFRIDDIFIGENIFENQIQDLNPNRYQLSYLNTELIIKFTDSKFNPNWFTKDFLIDLSTNSWGATRTQAQIEKLVYVLSVEFDSLFKAKLTQYITSSIEATFSKSCSRIGGFLPSGETLRLTKVNSPYYIHSTWIIDINARVEVEPGVDFKMAQGIKMIIYGSLVMNGTASHKIRFNHKSVNCLNEIKKICAVYYPYSVNLINYIVFRTKQAQEQSILRHVEFNKDITLFVDGYTPIIEYVMNENNKESAGFIVFQSLNDIQLNSVISRETHQYSLIICEQEKNIYIEYGIFNQTVYITKKIEKLIAPYLLESVNWGREYLIEENELFSLNFHLNIESSDCFKNLFVIVKTKTNQIIRIKSETSVFSLSNIGFKFYDSNNQTIVSTNKYTQFTTQNYLRIEVFLISCSGFDQIILRFKSLENIFAINDFSEPSKSLVFPPSLFELNDSVSNWFVTNSRLTFRFNQNSVSNQTKLDFVQTVLLSSSQAICGLEFDIGRYFNISIDDTFAIYLSTAQGDSLQIFKEHIYSFQNLKIRIFNDSLFSQHDAFKFIFQVLTTRNIQLDLKKVSILKCHLPHNYSVNIALKNSHLYRVSVDNSEFTPHGYNILLDSNVFFNQEYTLLHFETEIKSPVHINVAHLKNLKISNSMIYFCFYRHFNQFLYFTQLYHKSIDDGGYITIINDKILFEITSNYIWRNKFSGFVGINRNIYDSTGFNNLKTIISNNIIKNNMFTDKMISYYLFNTESTITITSNFITLNDGSAIILTGWRTSLPVSIKIKRNTFFFNKGFIIDTDIPTLIEKNAFLHNFALHDLYYIYYHSKAVDVPSKIGNWWNTLHISELAHKVRNYNASRLLSDIPISLSKHNLRNSYCEIGWTQLKGKCYLELPVQLSYTNAVQTCANLSSYLANFDPNSFDQFNRLRNSSVYKKNELIWLPADLNDTLCKAIRTFNGSIEKTSCLGFNHVVCEQGQTCSNLQCNQMNAICQASRCICAEGWHGPSCNEFNCIRMNNCSNRGTCISPNRCVCDENWSGLSCSSHFCFLFHSCGTCTSQQGCGWCDQTKRCLPATKTDRQPGREFNCSVWFYYNCLTPSDSQCTSWGIEKMPACDTTYCKINSTEFNKVTCQLCRDSVACFSSATKCRSWNETRCPFGKSKPDYSDANRMLFASVNSNVLIADTNVSVVIYKCPIKNPNSESKNIELLLLKNEQFADLIRLDSIIQSEQAKGIFHKVKRVQRLGDYLLIFSHMANLQELYTYADFETPVQKIFVWNENDDFFEPVNENLSPDLIARVRSGWNLSQAFDIENTTHFMCQGNKYKSVENFTLTQSYTLYLLVKKTGFTLQFAESDLIYSSAVDVARHLETVDSIEIQREPKHSDKVFVRTHLTDCSTELTEATLTNLLNRRVASSDLDCFGGINMNESVYVFDNEDMDNQQHNSFKPNDVIQGRSSTNSFVLQILNKRVFDDFLLFECKQIESLLNANQLAYYERVYQILDPQMSRIEGEANAKVLIPKLGASLNVGKVSLKSDINIDPDVNFNFKPFSIGFGMTISYDIVVALNGAVGASYEIGNEPILWRFFLPAPPPFVRIPGEFAISGQPEVSIDVDTGMQTQAQFRGSKKFYKEFKFNDDSDINLVDENPTLSKLPLNGDEFTNVNIEAKYTLQLKLGIPSYRILVKRPKKYPDWLDFWQLDTTVFEFNVFFALPFSLKLEIDTCFYKCYNENDEKAMAIKVSYGHLGCEAGAGLSSFSAILQTKFNLCGNGASPLNQHWCYTSKPKPPEKCPCKCDDGTISKREENGECQCDCSCEDGTKDILDKNGQCPCKCKCKNCKESVKKANGCFCPDDNQKCPDNRVVGQWVNCKFECAEKWPCGSPPFCSKMRRGSKCKTPHCPRGCVNGNCVSIGRCGAQCRCFSNWIGIRCDQFRSRALGDPWFSTLNGFLYGFQGLGDYWYCVDRMNDIGIQIRTYLFGGLNTYVSSISGVAVKLSNSMLTVFLNENKIYVLRLDNNIIENKNTKIVLKNSLNGMEEVINIDLERNLLAIDRKDHSSITIYMNKRNIDLSVNLKLLMSTKGLCGTSNKFSDNFQGPDGTLYSHSWLFGKSWKINGTNTLKLNTWSWNSSNFHPDDRINDLYDERYLILKDDYHTMLRPQSRMNNLAENFLVQREESRAKKLCKQNELKGDMLTICILDILATGDQSFAQSELYKTELCPNNCNGHGTCLYKGMCNCTEGWSGTDCDIGQCQFNCAPYGKCISGFCKCQDGWDGSDCKTKAKCDLVGNCTDQNHGTCVKNNVCKCFAGFGGDNCDQVSLCLALKKCNGNGYCASEKCTCNAGWTSADCSEPSCESLDFCSTHGICVGFDFCQCDEFYTGDSCSISECPQVNECSINGECIAPNTCRCYPGFKEPDCFQREECPQLKNCTENGVCINNATKCICYGGYEGDYCEIVQCDKVQYCSSHGKCVEPNLCECDFGYKGTFCNETTCESLNFCSYNGHCNEREECNCTTGWSGQSCSVAECSQVNFCSGNGVCIEPNICQCLKNFDGKACDLFIGENLFSPRFDPDTYETRVNELATIGTFILRVNATDDDKISTRNSMVKYSINTIGDFFDYFKIDERTGFIYLKKSLLLLEKPAVLIYVIAYDQGTPRKIGTAQVKINFDRISSCNDILNRVFSQISITKSPTPIVESFQLKPTDLTNRNVSYLLYSLKAFLKPFVYLDEFTGMLQINSSILVGNFDLNVISRQFQDDIICENKAIIRLRVLRAPISGESSSTTIITTLNSTTSPVTSMSIISSKTLTSTETSKALISIAFSTTSTSILTSKASKPTTTSETSTSKSTSKASTSTTTSETSTSKSTSKASTSTTTSETSTSISTSETLTSTSKKSSKTSTSISTSETLTSTSKKSSKTSTSISTSETLTSTSTSKASTSKKSSKTSTSISTLETLTSTTTPFSSTEISTDRTVIILTETSMLSPSPTSTDMTTKASLPLTKTSTNGQKTLSTSSSIYFSLIFILFSKIFSF